MKNDHLRQAVDLALIGQIPNGLKAAIDALIAKGEVKANILRFIRAKAGGRRGIVLAVEAYLGADDYGRCRET